MPGDTHHGNSVQLCPNPVLTSPARLPLAESTRTGFSLAQEVCRPCWCEHSAPAAEPGQGEKVVAVSRNVASGLCWGFDLVPG